MEYISPSYFPYVFLCVFLNLWFFMKSRVGPDMTEVRVLVQFRTSQVQKLYFDEIYGWFCIIFARETQKSNYFDQKPQYLTKNSENTPQIPENKWNIFRKHIYIYRYGIYKECITNISIDIYDITISIHQYIHQTHRRRLRRPPHWASVSDGYIYGYLWLYHKYLWIY